MAEHAGGDAGLLDLGIAIHDAAHPAKIDVERADRTAAHHDAGGGAIVGDGVEDLARVLETRIDDLQRGHHVFGRAQHVGEPDAGPLERLAENEGEFDLDPRQAEIPVRDLGAVGDHHMVEQMAVIRLVDLGGALHRLGGETDLVADQPGAGGDLALRDQARNRIGIIDGDVRKGPGELDGLLALLLGVHQDIGGLVAVSIREHGRPSVLLHFLRFAAPRPSTGRLHPVVFGRARHLLPAVVSAEQADAGSSLRPLLSGQDIILERPANDNEPRRPESAVLDGSATMFAEAVELRLAYTRVDDRLGELDATACSREFSGHGVAYVDLQAMKNFTRALRVFPISAATSPNIRSSFIWLRPHQWTDQCSDTVTPYSRPGSRVLVRVDLCRNRRGSHDRDQQHSVTIRFPSDYGAMTQFAADIEALLSGTLDEVILKATTT